MNSPSIDPAIIAAAVASALAQAGVAVKAGPTKAHSPASLFMVWQSFDREKPIVPKYIANAKAIFDRFATFLDDKHAIVSDVSQVTADIARDFMRAELARGVSYKTHNNILILLRSTFEELKPVGGQNPFGRIKCKKAEMIGRECFTEAEVEKILAAARDDDFIRPVVVTAAATAMRRGDCCLLRREAINIDARAVRVKTRKTGKYVWIPIFPMLDAELRSALSRQKVWAPRDFLFPEQAEMYLKNPDGISWRFKCLLRVAGVRGDDDLPPLEDCGPRMRTPTRRGLHSFRGTWVTLALNHGVPEAIVLDVTGIRTVQVARTHYFHPLIEQYRSALQSNLPPVLRTGTMSASEPNPAG